MSQCLLRSGRILVGTEHFSVSLLGESELFYSQHFPWSCLFKRACLKAQGLAVSWMDMAWPEF